jgi:hypothetical protein
MMVIVRLKGGLGNQFFQYAASYVLSKKLNCELKLDISSYDQKSLREFDLKNFDIEKNIAPQSESIKLGAPLNFKNRLIKKLRLSSLIFPQYIQEMESFAYDQRFALINKPVYLDGYWQNLNFFENYREELNCLFTPKVEISKQYLEYLTQIKTTQSVSIHVRKGDYVTDLNTQSIHDTCGLDYYMKAIKHINNEVEKPTYFIFSDDIGWCEENFDFLSSKVFINKTHGALEDFQLMRNCQSNIISNSTFSWWAAWLPGERGDTLDSQVVLPSRWLKNRLTQNLNLNFNRSVILEE